LFFIVVAIIVAGINNKKAAHMITNFDDYCIHQTYLPVAEPSQSDRNFYDRYWFNGIEPKQGDWMFEVGLGLYPNRRVMDGHFSVAIGDKQYAFHASRRAPKERGETQVGPLSVEILEPMRRIRIHLAPNEHLIECDLLFTASSVPHREPANVMHDDGHLIMQNTRFTQMGYWQGFFSVDGVRYEVDQAVATRDKSWGVRPVGEPVGGAPGLLNKEPGVYWLWSPINWGSFSTHMGTFEDRDGVPTQLSADWIPLYQQLEDIPAQDPAIVAMSEVKHEVQWLKGTRRAAKATMQLTAADGRVFDITLEPLQRFYTLGIGYNHSEWGHAMWRAELETAREEWDLNTIDELEYAFIHNHQAVKAQMVCSDGSRHEGLGTLETLVVGRHARSGFEDFFDGAK
jgi:hypothetical protein